MQQMQYNMLAIAAWLTILGLAVTPTGHAAEFDRFGGCTAIQGEATGRWHTQKILGRHWLVTPEGNVFFVLGVNHFYQLEQSQRTQVVDNLRSWHFNTAGYDAPAWLATEMPCFVHITLHNAVHWLPPNQFGFVDVFGEDFARHVDSTIAKACRQNRDNPNVIGYSMTDTPRYELDTARRRRGEDWVSHIRRLDSTAPGKQEYVAFLRNQYGEDVDRFRRAYRLPLVTSFEDLLSYDFSGLELTRPAVRADDEAFLVEIATRIYCLTREAFDRHDPEALVLSEKFKMHDHTDAILEVAAVHCDIISVQPGPTHGPDAGQGPDESQFNRTYWRRLHDVTDRPIFICDHACTFPTSEFPRTLWHQLPSEEAAGAHYGAYVRQVAAEPYIVGYQRCQYMSRYDPLRSLLKQGLLDIEGRPYRRLVQQAAATNREVLENMYKRTVMPEAESQWSP